MLNCTLTGLKREDQYARLAAVGDNAKTRRICARVETEFDGHPVSRKVNNTRLDSPVLIEDLAADED